MKWFLIYTIASFPPCGGIDCGINPSYRPTYVDQRIEMPSLEVCRQVRAVNKGSRCLTEDLEEEAAKGDKLTITPRSSGAIPLLVEPNITPN